MSDRDVLKQFVKISKQRMYHHYLPKLIKSIEGIHSELLWHKESECMNW